VPLCSSRRRRRCCYYKIWQKFDSNGYDITIARFDKNYEKKESYVRFVVRAYICMYGILCMGDNNDDDNNNNNNNNRRINKTL
jgi:hypothetical protein